MGETACAVGVRDGRVAAPEDKTVREPEMDMEETEDDKVRAACRAGNDRDVEGSKHGGMTAVSGRMSVGELHSTSMAGGILWACVDKERREAFALDRVCVLDKENEETAEAIGALWATEEDNEAGKSTEEDECGGGK